ncbi:MAG: hypothetical protein GY767_14065 [Shimia sp.]|nr:hypothetical protein [Shimia sp.]
MPLVRAEVSREASACIAYAAKMLDVSETVCWGLFLNMALNGKSPDKVALAIVEALERNEVSNEPEEQSAK